MKFSQDYDYMLIIAIDPQTNEEHNLLHWHLHHFFMKYENRSNCNERWTTLSEIFSELKINTDFWSRSANN